jgi:hypothetical protein
LHNADRHNSSHHNQDEKNVRDDQCSKREQSQSTNHDTSQGSVGRCVFSLLFVWILRHDQPVLKPQPEHSGTTKIKERKQRFLFVCFADFSISQVADKKLNFDAVIHWAFQLCRGSSLSAFKGCAQEFIPHRGTTRSRVPQKTESNCEHESK